MESVLLTTTCTCCGKQLSEKHNLGRHMTAHHCHTTDSIGHTTTILHSSSWQGCSWLKLQGWSNKGQMLVCGQSGTKTKAHSEGRTLKTVSQRFERERISGRVEARLIKWSCQRQQLGPVPYVTNSLTQLKNQSPGPLHIALCYNSGGNGSISNFFSFRAT